MVQARYILEAGRGNGRFKALYSDSSSQYLFLPEGVAPENFKREESELYVLLDADALSPELLVELPVYWREMGARCVLFADKPDSEVYNAARKSGTAFVASTSIIRKNPSIFFRRNSKHRDREGVVLLFDQNEARIAIIREIFAVFAHDLQVYHSVPPFIEALGRDCSGILINAGSSAFDMRRFVVEAHKHSALRKVAVIPFVESGAGFDFTTVCGGLQRYARAIVSPEEMLSFLVNVFFRRELYRGQARLNAAIPTNQSDLYSKAGFARICHEMGADVFALPDITTNGNLEKWIDTSRVFIQVCERVQCLRWLLLPHDDRSTCAVGGAARTEKYHPES